MVDATFGWVPIEYDVWLKNNDLTISTKCRTWLFLLTNCRTRRNVASTTSGMRPIVVSAIWFWTNCHAPFAPTSPYMYWRSILLCFLKTDLLWYPLKQHHVHHLDVFPLKENAIHRNRWYNLKDYILERICKQRNCLKSIYSINYRYFKFTKFALESAWGSRHVLTPVTSLTHIDFLVGLPCARSACVLTKLAVHLYWNFDLISEKNSSRVW